MRLKVFVLFLALFAATTSAHIYTIDGCLNYMVTKSMGRYGTLAIPKFMMTVEGRDGRDYSKLGIGQSLVSLPLFWLGSLVERLSPRNPAFIAYSEQVTIPRGSHAITAEPQTLIHLSDREGAPIFFVTLTNALVAAAVCLLFWLILGGFGASRTWALAGTAMLGFATPLWVYARDLFGEPLFTACLLATFYLLADGRRTLPMRSLVLAGLASSLGILTRASFIPLVGIFATYLVLCSENKRSGLERALAYMSLCLPGIAVFALLNQARFGSIFLSGYHTAFDKGFSVPIYKGIVWNLFSPYRSLVLYAPCVLLGFLGLGAFIRRYRAQAALVISIVAYIFLVYSGWWAWHGGWCWGPRFLVPVVPLLLIPGFATGGGRARAVWLALGLAGAGFMVQLGAILINYTTAYDYWIKIGVLDWAEKNIEMFSPITVHWKAVLATNPSNYDLWLIQVMKVNPAAGVITAAALLALAIIVGKDIWGNRNTGRSGGPA
jgi:hypothetical protein